jgi:hypothetical protein
MAPAVSARSCRGARALQASAAFALEGGCCERWHELRVQGRHALAQGAAETACDQRSRAKAWQPVPMIFLKCDEEIPPGSQVRDTGCNACAVRPYPRCGIQRKSHLRCMGKIWNIAFTMHSEPRWHCAHHQFPLELGDRSGRNSFQ